MLEEGGALVEILRASKESEGIEGISTPFKLGSFPTKGSTDIDAFLLIPQDYYYLGNV